MTVHSPRLARHAAFAALVALASLALGGSARPCGSPGYAAASLRGPGGGTVASSGQVTVGVDKHVWNVVSVAASPEARVVPGSIQFFATLDHTTYGTHTASASQPTWGAEYS